MECKKNKQMRWTTSFLAPECWALIQAHLRLSVPICECATIVPYVLPILIAPHLRCLPMRTQITWGHWNGNSVDYLEVHALYKLRPKPHKQTTSGREIIVPVNFDFQTNSRMQNKFPFKYMPVLSASSLFCYFFAVQLTASIFNYTIFRNTTAENKHHPN